MKAEIKFDGQMTLVFRLTSENFVKLHFKKNYSGTLESHYRNRAMVFLTANKEFQFKKLEA